MNEPPRHQGTKLVGSPPDHDLIAREIVDSAFVVHSTLGPGLLESVYEQCLAAELGARNVSAIRQMPVPLHYRDEHIDAGFRIDLPVGGAVIVEVKATERILPVHEAQLLTYMKLSGHRLGFLINFNVALIKDGIRRRIR
jgi:GxxExxY protein